MLRQILNNFLLGYFMLASIFPKTDFGQLGSLVDLVRHYQEHKLELEDPDLSFWTFIKMHYIQTESHDHTDNHSHEDLPFHQISSSIDLISTPLPSNFDDGNLGTHLNIFTVKSVLSFDFLKQVYRPPSIA